MTNMKSIPALSNMHMSIKPNIEQVRTYSFRSTMFTWKCHASLKFHFGQNERYEIHTILSLFSLQFIGTQVKSWLNTEVRFSTEMKSHTALSWFYLSCKRTLKKTIFPLKSSKTFGFLHSNLHSIKKHTLAKIPI